MTRSAALKGYLLAAALVPEAAAACSPASHTPSLRPETGAGCEWVVRPDEYTSIARAALLDLGGGYILQVIREGNGCFSEVSALVTNCNTGQAALYGLDRLQPMQNGPKPRIAPLVEALQKNRRPLTRERLVTLLKQAGVTRGKTVPVGAGLRFGDQVQMPLECGCRTAYPGLRN